MFCDPRAAPPDAEDGKPSEGVYVLRPHRGPRRSQGRSAEDTKEAHRISLTELQIVSIDEARNLLSPYTGSQSEDATK